MRSVPKVSMLTMLLFHSALLPYIDYTYTLENRLRTSLPFIGSAQTAKQNTNRQSDPDR